MKLLLASKSEARRRMLAAAGVPFEVAEVDFDEEAAKARLRSRAVGAGDLALGLAEAKALAADAGQKALVLGSDQVLEREDGSMLDKVRSREELAEQLRSLRGKSHRLHSAAAVSEEGEVAWRDVETATLWMRDFSDAFLDTYLDREFATVRWSVGGYHVEGPGAQLFERIEGSHFAVLGMPLLPLLGYLRKRGFLER